MKKFMTALVLTLVTTAAFAQYRPGPRPRPRPPGQHFPRPVPRPVNCQALMLDRYNRVVRTYWGTRDWNSGMCRDALRQCNFDQRRMGNWNLRCVQR